MIYSNGRYINSDQAPISVMDRGFLLGDGIFETLKAYQGWVFGLHQHWQRLKNTSEFLQIPLDLNLEDLEKICAQLLALNHLQTNEAVIRLTLSRGEGPRGLTPPIAPHPTLVISASAYNRVLNEQSLWVVNIRRNEHSPLSRIKSLNYLENILAKMAAIKAGAEDAILLNTQGRVAGGSCANIFLVSKKEKIITPGLDQGVLAGVTRDLVIKLAKEMNMDMEEGSVELADLENAQEIFLTNSLIEIQGVNQVNGRLLSHPTSSSITRLLKDAYRQLVNSGEYRGT